MAVAIAVAFDGNAGNTLNHVCNGEVRGNLDGFAGNDIHDLARTTLHEAGGVVAGAVALAGDGHFVEFKAFRSFEC
ncbi:hypothetical protein D3C87_1694040 [compost metagenome]